jgi:uroporphyrinogen-III decarboxylase
VSESGKIKKFACPGENLDEIPVSLAEREGLTFPEVHSDAARMKKLALALKEYRQDSFVHVPFCTTVLSEALGVPVDLGGPGVAPHVKEPLFDDVSALSRSLNTDGGRVAVVLDAVRELSRTENVVLNVDGIFTIASALLDATKIYRAMHNNGGVVAGLFERIGAFVADYVRSGLEAGAKLISYADPLGDIAMTGPQAFGDFVAAPTVGVIKKSLALFGEAAFSGAIFHLCGRVTNGLSHLGIVGIESAVAEGARNYGEALLILNSTRGACFFGNSCVKKTSLQTQPVEAYILHLRSNSKRSGERS